MPRTVKRKDVVLLLPPPSIPKNGESSKMALHHQPPSLDVLLMAHQMAQERGEQMDIEAYMTDEMRREWFNRRTPFLQGTGEEPARKRRRMSGEERHTNGDGETREELQLESPIPHSSSNHTHSPSPTWATKRLKPSLVEQHWNHRRRSYLPAEAEPSLAESSQMGSNREEAVVSAEAKESQDGTTSIPAEELVVHPPEQKPNGVFGPGTGHWKRKSEVGVGVDKEEIQASASYWNTLLVRARKDRGPQWDYSTQSHQVDRYSRAYYTHMDKAIPADEEETKIETEGEGKEVEGKPNGEGIPSFNALTRTGSISETGGSGLKRSHSQVKESAISAESLPPRSDSLYPGLSLSNSNLNTGPTGPGGGFTSSAPSTTQLQQMHQAQHNLLLQKQREQAQHAQSSPSGSGPSGGPAPGQGQGQAISSAQLFQFHQQQQQQQRLPPHMQQHLQSSSSSTSLHPQYSSPSSTGGGGLPHNTPSPAGGNTGLPRTVSPASIYSNNGQGQNLQRTNSFSSSTSNNPSASNGTGINNPSFPTYPPPQSNPYPPIGNQTQLYPPPSLSMGMKPPQRDINQSPIQPPPRPTSTSQVPQYPHLTPQQQQQQQVWMQQASSMGVSMAQFQSMMQAHQQHQMQQQQQGGMNPQAMHQLGRPAGSGSVSLAQITGGQGMGGMGNGMRNGSGGPMLGGGGN